MRDKYFKPKTIDSAEERPANKPMYVTPEFTDENLTSSHPNQPKKLFKSLLILPNCLKELNYLEFSDRVFTKKKDSENYVAFKALKKIIDFIVNENGELRLNSQKIDEYLKP